MKLTRITYLVILGSCFCFQCSDNSKSLNSQNSSSMNKVGVANSSEAQLRSTHQDKQEDPQAHSAAIESSLRREAEKLGLKTLNDPMADYSSEIRVWVGFGIVYPRCFILRRTAGKQEAFFMTYEILGSNKKVKVSKTVLKPPRSGWSEFERFLKVQGIDFPIKLTSQLSPDPDVQIIVVQTGSKDVYSMVYFSLNGDSQDFQRVQAVCEKIEDEFEIVMGCKQ
jgi:hypothetical protein